MVVAVEQSRLLPTPQDVGEARGVGEVALHQCLRMGGQMLQRLRWIVSSGAQDAGGLARDVSPVKTHPMFLVLFEGLSEVDYFPWL